MIPFINLQFQFQLHKKELLQSVTRVMESGVYLMGPELVLFEKEFSKFVGIKHSIGVGSGTDALTLAIRGLGLGPKDEVIVPANAYPTAFGVAAAGVKIKLCDVDPDTLNVSAETIERGVTKKTRAIVVVHLYGLPAPMEEIMMFAKNHKLFVIEDCAQAVGAKIGSQHVGTFGDAACFSFYPTKNLGAMGDGGAVAANKKNLAERVRRLRMYGEDIRYHSVELSTHSRLDEIQSAILRVRLAHLDEELEARQMMASYYRRKLPAEILVPKVIPDGMNHAQHLFVIRLKDREKVRRNLKDEGIETAIHYPVPVHLQPAFFYLGYKKGDFPVSEDACRKVLSLPFYSGLTSIDQKRTVLGVRPGLSLK